MRTSIILAFFILLGTLTYAQSTTVKVNPDGTHTVIHRTGNSRDQKIYKKNKAEKKKRKAKKRKKKVKVQKR